MAAALRCSYRRAAALICGLNVVILLYVLQLIGSYVYRPSAMRWRRPQALSMQEANRILESYEIRKKVEPHELIERVKEINLESDRESMLPGKIRENAAAEISERLRELEVNQTFNHKSISEWRKKKLTNSERGNSTESDINHELAQEEVTKLVELGWLQQDATENPPESSDAANILPVVTGPEVEDGIIPGRRLPPECHAEAHTDYDGTAVRWGLTHHTESAADCCQACINQAKSAKAGEMKCNIWVFCAAENGCYSPDRYEHKHQECWLKQSMEPKLNFKGHYHEEYRQTHPNAPVVVPWVSGVLSV